MQVALLTQRGIIFCYIEAERLVRLREKVLSLGGDTLISIEIAREGGDVSYKVEARNILVSYERR